MFSCSYSRPVPTVVEGLREVSGSSLRWERAEEVRVVLVLKGGGARGALRAAAKLSK